MRLLLALFACTTATADPPVAPAAPPTPTALGEPAPAAAEHRAAVHERMAAHYLLATSARAAVLRGDLDTAKDQGARLAALPREGQPADWAPHLALIEQAGRDLAQAPDLDDAGAAIGQLATVCGDCHEATGGGPKLSGESAPAPAWTEAAHMSRHLWGSEWVWIGILANDDAAVLRGAGAIADGPVVNPSPTSDPAIVEQEAALHAIAKRIVDAPDLGARRAMYGDLVAACGTCHRALEAEGRTPR